MSERCSPIASFAHATSSGATGMLQSRSECGTLAASRKRWKASTTCSPRPGLAWIRSLTNIPCISRDRARSYPIFLEARTNVLIIFARKETCICRSTSNLRPFRVCMIERIPPHPDFLSTTRNSISGKSQTI